MSKALNITKPHWRCRCGCVVFPLGDETSCDCADVYEQDWTLIEPTIPTGDELTRLRAENARLREALANVHEGAARQLAEPRNHDDDQFALTSICTVAEAALAGKDK